MKCRGADVVIQTLKQDGVDLVFGYPGGAIMPVYDALVNSGIRHILVRHEQGAAHAAEGYARASGKVGVCIVTSGPGATNLVTGIADAFMDSVPIVCLTGQVPTQMMGTDAFQEIDIYGITMPVVKHSFVVKDPQKLQSVIHQAFNIAKSGRPGPVLVDLPKDVQIAQVNLDPTLPNGALNGIIQLSSGDFEHAAQLISNSQRPIILAGNGIYHANALHEFRTFIEKVKVPTVNTLKGLGTVSGRHPMFLGMLGMHGTKVANMAIQNCDLLIGIGVRFDDRATGKVSEFAPKAKVIHMDIDRAEIGKMLQPAVALHGDLKQTLPVLTNLCSTPDIEDWVTHVEKLKAYKPGYYKRQLTPQWLLELLSDEAPPDAIVTSDVGQHQMWVAQYFKFEHPSCWITSGGAGTMGFGLPAAVGAQLAKPENIVICITGDGSFMMNIQELATVRRYNLPIKIFLLDNKALGLVRQWQELFFDRRFSEIDLSDNPDFVKLAESFGIRGIKLNHDRHVPSIIHETLRSEGPVLVQCEIESDTYVWPLVVPGKSNSEMLEESKA